LIKEFRGVLIPELNVLVDLGSGEIQRVQEHEARRIIARWNLDNVTESPYIISGRFFPRAFVWLNVRT